MVAMFWPSSGEKINLEAFRRAAKGEAAPVGMLIDSSAPTDPFRYTHQAGDVGALLGDLVPAVHHGDPRRSSN